MEQLSDWECSNNSTTNCKGACLASAQFNYDHLSDIAEAENGKVLLGTIRSEIAYLQLLNPMTGAFIGLHDNTEDDNVKMKVLPRKKV